LSHHGGKRKKLVMPCRAGGLTRRNLQICDRGTARLNSGND
jgi:hypothetical protein